ncbi:hypothetical protein EI42_05631 [Thermosporothrix hazakensis]|jgi:phage tail protein X|uniref:Transposase n=1 Tax=Thermosporothrix hazakensis TaxID=644383 RepID=A0A326TW97_THEHA|nr:hypothetical protein [Thermosporothrix hazakensis]PZW21095.1 hypothetical protein EI42_05631 [Thermosporothrix hazakensis]GCE50739.1 hypothetical protein KTH_56080 [Thermosporothrix hazakensis]
MVLLERCKEQAIRAWLQAHPGIALVSRDRGKMNTHSSGAPHVQEVLDRWHLLRNLGEMFQKGLAKALPTPAARSTSVSTGRYAQSVTIPPPTLNAQRASYASSPL